MRVKKYMTNCLVNNMDLKIGQTVWYWANYGSVDLKESKILVLDGEKNVKVRWFDRKKGFLRVLVWGKYISCWITESEVYTSKQDAIEAMQKKLKKIACADMKIPESCYLTDCEYRVLADILMEYRHHLLLHDTYGHQSDCAILEKIQRKILNGLVE